MSGPAGDCDVCPRDADSWSPICWMFVGSGRYSKLMSAGALAATELLCNIEPRCTCLKWWGRSLQRRSVAPPPRVHLNRTAYKDEL
jgi:hypothetical protein